MINSHSADSLIYAVQQGIVSEREAEYYVSQLEKKHFEKKVLMWGFHYFPHKFPAEFNDLHEYLESVMHEDMTCTIASRGHAKTTIMCFLIPIYLALVETGKYKHFLNIQSTITKAININLSIRDELENNELLIRDYGLQVSKIKWTEKQFALKNGTIFTAIAPGESMRGINFRGIRPDYFVGDDLFDDDDRYNVERVEKKVHWVWASLYPARNQHAKCCFHFIGTPIHRSDLLQRLIKNTKVKSRVFPAIIDEATKKTLWLPYEKLMEMKEFIGSVLFTQEYMCELIDDETAIIKEKDLRFYEDIPDNEKIISTIITCDPAGTDKKCNDKTAIAVIFKTDAYRFYIHDVRVGHFKSIEIIDILYDLQRRYDSEVIIETIGNFQVLLPYLNKKGIRYKAITHKPNKLVELRGVAVHFETHNVFINSHIKTKIKNTLIEQLILISPPNDDIRDAIIIGLKDTKVRKAYPEFNRSKNIIPTFTIRNHFLVQVGIKIEKDCTYLVWRAIDEKDNWFYFRCERIVGSGKDIAHHIIEIARESGLNVVTAVIERKENIVGLLNENHTINDLHYELYYNDIDFIQIRGTIEESTRLLNYKFLPTHSGLTSAFIFQTLPTLQAQTEDWGFDEKGKLNPNGYEYAFCSLLLAMTNTLHEDMYSKNRYKHLEDEEDDDDD